MALRDDFKRCDRRLIVSAFTFPKILRVVSMRSLVLKANFIKPSFSEGDMTMHIPTTCVDQLCATLALIIAEVQFVRKALMIRCYFFIFALSKSSDVNAIGNNSETLNFL